MFNESNTHSPGQKERVVLTGGTEGIGKAIAKELSQDNHRVVICARSQEKLSEMEASTGFKAVQLDLADTEQIADFIEESHESMGGISTLILNAAVTGIRESEEYTFRVVRDAQIELIRSAAKALRESKGRIIFLTSAQAQKFIEGHEHYGQAKRDVENYLKDFAEQPENTNIQIFFVNPGHVDTRMNEEAIEYGVPAIRDRSLQAKAQQKFRDPNIVGRIISKMSLTGHQFNPQTQKYDLPISQADIVAISNENILFEQELAQEKPR